MSKQPVEIRRSDRLSGDGSDLMEDLAKLRKPLAGESDLVQALNRMVREGELYEKLPDNRVHCFACGHRCKISEGGRGICQVRYNLGGKLYVPYGYVAALQSDPIEKKPFFHVLPGSDALTFGMLGCDLHCSYCFTGDTRVVTDRGPLTLAELFASAPRVEQRTDGAVAYPNGLRVIVASGRWQKVEAVFKHPYRGPLAVIRPYYWPALRCTPDHRVFATDDATRAPEPIQARYLTAKHYLAIPRHYTFSSPQIIDVTQELGSHPVTYRVPWDLSVEKREAIAEATARGETSRQMGVALGKDPSCIRHVRSKLARGRGKDVRISGPLIEDGRLRFPNEHRPGIPLVISLDTDMARLLGYYCAEGSVVRTQNRPNSHVLNFSFAREDTEHVKEVHWLLQHCLDVEAALITHETTRALAVNKASVALLFKALCGVRAQEKHVPPYLFDTPRPVVEAFVDAYIAGDGHGYRDGKISVTTVSPALAYGIAQLVLKLGHLPSLYDTPMPEGGIVQGRKVKRAPHQYTVVWYENASIARQVIETEKYYLVPLRGITFEEYSGDVYNMQVAEEHNYLAGFFLVANCQNWDISQALRDGAAGRPPSLVTPQQLVEIGKRHHARVVASSYNEPLITSEWAVEIFKHATAAGFLCAYVSNGNATREVLEYIRPYVRAYKIDLKSMRDKPYRQLGAPLEHILDGIRMVHEMGFWLEIVTLVVPGFNDSDEELRDAAQFLVSLSPDIPWHVTAFHPDYKMLDHENTTVRHLLRACEIGRAAGLRYVYAGNLPGMVGEWENTYCPNCGELLIERYGYMILAYRLTGSGTCQKCNTRIPGLWHQNPREVRLGDAAVWWMRRPRAVR